MTTYTAPDVSALLARLERAEARIHALECDAMGLEDNTRRIYRLERRMEGVEVRTNAVHDVLVGKPSAPAPKRPPTVLDAGSDGGAKVISLRRAAG